MALSMAASSTFSAGLAGLERPVNAKNQQARRPLTVTARTSRGSAKVVDTMTCEFLCPIPLSTCSYRQRQEGDIGPAVCSQSPLVRLYGTLLLCEL